MEDLPAEGTSPYIIMTNRHLRDTLLAKGYRVHYKEFSGGHECHKWQGTLAEGLIALLGNC
jgi:enterochelin esterase family protein